MQHSTSSDYRAGDAERAGGEEGSQALRVEAGDNALVGGFIISSADSKRVLLRGIGPSLNVNGNPVEAGWTIRPSSCSTGMIRRSHSMLIGRSRSRAARSCPAASPPKDNREAAIARILQPDTYTAVMSGKNDSAGIRLLEIYDRDAGGNAELAKHQHARHCPHLSLIHI